MWSCRDSFGSCTGPTGLTKLPRSSLAALPLTYALVFPLKLTILSVERGRQRKSNSEERVVFFLQNLSRLSEIELYIPFFERKRNILTDLSADLFLLYSDLNTYKPNIKYKHFAYCFYMRTNTNLQVKYKQSCKTNNFSIHI